MNADDRSSSVRAPAWLNAGAPKPLPEQIEALLALAQRDLESDRQEAVRRLEQAVAIARALDDPDVLVRTLHEAAVGLQQSQRPDRAFILCLEAQPVLERLDDPWLALRLVLLRGICFVDVGQYDRAQQLIGHALSGFVAMNDPQMRGRCHAAMARACGLAQDLQAAVDHAEKALSCLNATPADAAEHRRAVEDKARWCMALAEQRAARGDTAGARWQWQRAARALPDPLAREPNAAARDGVVALDTAVAVFGALHDAARCGRALTQLVRAARSSRRPIDRGLAWMRLSHCDVAGHRPSRAIACARRAAACLPLSSQEPSRPTALFLLARLLEAAGDFKGAYEAHDDASRVEALLEKQAVMVRAELLALDLEAEQEQRRSAQTLQYAQRLSKVGEVVASINHDLNQPMASIKMLAETSLDMIDTEARAQMQQDVAVMQDRAASLAELLARLPAFEGAAQSRSSRIGIHSAIDEALSVVGARLKSSRCEVVRDVPAADVEAAFDRLVQVLAQLFNNALDAMRAQPTPRLRLHGRSDGHVFRLEIEDTGPGLTGPALDRLFEPFNSTRAHQLGIGLALALDALRDMNGDLSASSAASGGALMCVSLQLAPAPTSARQC